MKQRYIYSFLFGLPGIGISAFAAVFAGGAVAGLFWFLIVGDNVWPSWTDWIIKVVSGVVFALTLSIIVITGYLYGRKREKSNKSFNAKHVVILVATSILLAFFIISFQRGYIFTKPDHQICYDLCIQEGYDGLLTSVGPNVGGKRSCSCWNDTMDKYDEIGIIE